MPRPGPRRPSVTLRMSQDGIDKVDALASSTGQTRSDAIRVLLAEALKSDKTVTAARRRLEAMRTQDV